MQEWREEWVQQVSLPQAPTLQFRELTGYSNAFFRELLHLSTRLLLVGLLFLLAQSVLVLIVAGMTILFCTFLAEEVGIIGRYSGLMIMQIGRREAWYLGIRLPVAHLREMKLIGQ
jgi:hypothetical protein